jgi:hypothetical protein
MQGLIYRVDCFTIPGMVPRIFASPPIHTLNILGNLPIITHLQFESRLLATVREIADKVKLVRLARMYEPAQHERFFTAWSATEVDLSVWRNEVSSSDRML